MIRTLNDHGLEEAILEVEGYIIVAFLQKTSIPCDHFLPEFKVLSDLMESKAKFFMVDAGENPTITDEVGITAVPTTVAFVDGDEVARYEGPYSWEALKDRLSALIANRKV